GFEPAPAHPVRSHRYAAPSALLLPRAGHVNHLDGSDLGFRCQGGAMCRGAFPFAARRRRSKSAQATSLAVSSMGTASRACDTGQPSLVASAISWNVSSGMPDTRASVWSSILVILNPASPLSMCTLAVVCTESGTWPAFDSPPDRALDY